MNTATQDNRQKRGAATRHAMMRAAESLISEQGIENVSIRDIVQAAGQKNESALQYHFGNIKGLIAAIKEERSSQINQRRLELIASQLSDTPDPDLREICRLMVIPSFELAKADPDFKKYVICFSDELALSDEPFRLASRNMETADRDQPLADLLRSALPHLDSHHYTRRMDHAIRMISSAMHHHARQKGSFRGKQANLFLESLLDALVGLLGAPVSDETRACDDL